MALRSTSESLSFPIADHAILLDSLNRKPSWHAPEQPIPEAPPKPTEAKPKMQRLLSKEKLQMEWKVQRQAASHVRCFWPLEGLEMLRFHGIHGPDGSNLGLRWPTKTCARQ